MTIVVALRSVGRADGALVGGKGANLGEAIQAGLPVPGGFCVTTEAFRLHMAAVDARNLIEQLDGIAPDDGPAIGRIGGALRARVTAIPLPDLVAAAIIAAWEREDPAAAWAVRSSATLEDLPTASFAGQQDSYLHVVGEAALLDRVRACFASLFTDRAIAYRAREGFGHRSVGLCVVVQRMIDPDAAGIAFSADPVSGNRHIATIDAGLGLGEALVCGIVEPDLVRVDRRTGRVLDLRVGDKRSKIVARPGGGTDRVDVPEAQAKARVLDDAGIAEIVALLGRVEAHFGGPQDVEWGRSDGRIWLLQARPITTLFPLPSPCPADEGPHVYLSFGHVQMMTEPISPMGQSAFRRILSFGGPAARGERVLASGGGRLFIDITPLFRVAPLRTKLPVIAGNIDRFIASALRDLSARPDFTAPKPNRIGLVRTLAPLLVPTLFRLQANLWLLDPRRSRESAERALHGLVGDLDAAIAAAPGLVERLTVIDRAMGSLGPNLLRHVIPRMAAGVLSRFLLRALLRGRVDPADLDRLDRALPGNVTTEMDLEVADLAELASRTPTIAAALGDPDFGFRRSDLSATPGAANFLASWDRWMARHGDRGAAEIDVARPRYADDPSVILRAIAGNLAAGGSLGHREGHARLAASADETARQIGRQIGGLRGALVRRLLRVLRALAGLRESPKRHIVRVLGRVRAAVEQGGAELVRARAIARPDDVFWLTLDELQAALASPAADLAGRVSERKRQWEAFVRLVPPRVLTSDGESVVGKTEDRALPAGALPGTGASAGVVEGLARVVLDPATTTLRRGEILVAPYTDPGWTPLFMHAAAVVTEVGGIMTHGSVIAREYGIPAVVSVAGATRRIVTGDRLRVDGTAGWVQILPGSPTPADSNPPRPLPPRGPP